METMDRVMQGIKKAADTAQKETARLTGIAKLKYKLMREKTGLDDLYEELGRLTYRQAKEGNVTENEAAEIVARIDVSKAEIEHLKIKIRLAKEQGKKSSPAGCGCAAEAEKSCPKCACASETEEKAEDGSEEKSEE